MAFCAADGAFPSFLELQADYDLERHANRIARPSSAAFDPGTWSTTPTRFRSPFVPPTVRIAIKSSEEPIAPVEGAS